MALTIQSCEKNENAPSSPSAIETNKLLFSYYTLNGSSIDGRGMQCDLTTNPYTLTTILPGALGLRVNNASTEIIYYASLGVSIDIFRSSISGAGVIDLTPDSANQYIDSSPEWSPNGEQILFTRYFKANGKEALVKMNRDGSGIQLLTDTTKIKGVVGGTWSPNGRSIALCGIPVNSVSEKRLYTFDSSGANLYQCDSLTNAAIPIFSPDGSLIAYGNSSGLAVYNIASKNVVPITISGSRAISYGFAWKPNGTLMCGIRNTATSKYDLYVVTISSSVTSSVLATGFSESFSAVSSPDGQSVAMLGIASSDTSLSLYSVGANGSNFKKMKTVDDNKSATTYPENGMFWLN